MIARPFAFVLLLVGALGVSHAQPIISYGSNGGTLTGGAINSQPHSWRGFMGAGSPAGSVIVTDSATARVGGRNVPMALARTVPWSGVANLATRALPGIAIGVALWDIWDNMRTRPDGSGGQVADAGVDPETIQPCYVTNDLPGIQPGCLSSPSAVEQVALTRMSTSYGECVVYTPNTGPLVENSQNNGQAPGGGVLYCVLNGQPAYPSYTYVRGADSLSDSPCPVAIDALNPAQSYGYGHPRGFDGRCHTGRYDPLSAAAAEALFQQYGPKGQAPEILRDSIGPGRDAAPLASPVAGTSSGPGSSTGAPTTTTTTNGPSGTTTTTTTPTQTITYNNNNYTYTTTVVTTVNNNGGTTTTTTTGEGDGTAPVEAKTDCDKYPDALGCIKLGDLPTDAPQVDTRTVSYAEEDLGLGGSCPPDRHMPFRGSDLVLKYQPACDVAPVVSAGLLALAALSCIGIVVGALRQ